MHGVEFGPFKLFVLERRLARQSSAVSLGDRAFDLLVVLVENAGRVMSKQDLLARVWPDTIVEESSLRGHISALRKALGDGVDGARYIANVAGRGYCFVHQVERTAVPGHSEPAALPSGRGALPRISTRVIGRDNDTCAIEGMLSEHRFVTVHGPGGIGKTTITLAVAHSCGRSFRDGVHFLDLGVHPSHETAAGVLAAALGLAGGTSDPTFTIVNCLRDRHMLLVLDCCEHVVDSAAALAETVFREMPGVSILATSREPLRADGEHVYPLAPMNLPPEGAIVNAANVLTYPAASLFFERVVASGHQMELNDDDALVVADICRKVDGIALALELAAGRVGTHGLRGTSDLLDGRLKLLWQGRRTALPRHQTLHATFDWSYELLSENERIVLRRLSVFVGPFTISEALNVVEGSGIDVSEIIEILPQLVSKSLVVADMTRETTLYRLLDTMRAYARVKLIEAGEEAIAARRHALCYQEPLRMVASTTRIPSENGPVTMRSLGNIRAALEWSFSAAGEAGLGVRLTADSVRIFLRGGLLAECRRWCERALTALTDELRDTPYEMALYAALGHAMLYSSDNSKEARDLLYRALEIAVALEDYDGQFRLLGCLHVYDRRTGDFSQLPAIAQRAAALAEHLKESAMAPAADVLVGASHYLTGNLSEARASFTRVLQRPENATHATTNFLDYRTEALFLLARILWLQGLPDQAVKAVHEAESAGTKDILAACQALVLASDVFHGRGDWHVFERYVDQLIRYATRYSLEPYRLLGLGLKGEVLFRHGEHESGIGLIRDALTGLRAENFEIYTPFFTCTLAEGLALRGFFDQALGLMEDTIAGAWRRQGMHNIPELLRVHGELFVKAGNEHCAERLFEQSISIAETQTALSWRLRTATSFARLRARQHRHEEAWTMLAETYARFDEGLHTADLKAAKLLLDEIGRFSQT